jgi:hypothetical protein
MSRCNQYLLIVLVCAVLVGAGSMAAAQDDAKQPAPAAEKQTKITVSKETTAVTKPLTSEGYVNYLEAINQHYGRGVKPEDNAAVLLYPLSHEPTSEEFRTAFYGRLGVPVPENDGSQLIALEQLDTDRRLSNDERNALFEQQSKAVAAPWSADQYPQIARWIQVNQAALAKAAEASRRPHFFSPLVGDESDMLIAVLLPGAQGSRNIARALTARAMLRLQEGKYDEAWQDLIATERLGRLVGRGPTLIESLVGIAVEGLAIGGIKQYLQHATLTAEQARAKQQELSQLPLAATMADKLDISERYMSLDAVSHLARGNKETLASILDKPLAFGPFQKANWNVTLRRLNQQYDRYVKIIRNPDHAERQKKLREFDGELRDLGSDVGNLLKMLERVGRAENVPDTLGEIFGERLIAMLFPAIDAAMSAETRAQQEMDQLLLAFRLAAYRADQGNYPNSLADLMAADSQAIPIDRFTGNDLTYRTANGGYLLYSFGPNGEDNGGRTAAQRTETGDPQADDITVKIERRD